MGPFFNQFYACQGDTPKRSAAHLYPLLIGSCPPRLNTECRIPNNVNLGKKKLNINVFGTLDYVFDRLVM